MANYIKRRALPSSDKPLRTLPAALAAAHRLSYDRAEHECPDARVRVVGRPGAFRLLPFTNGGGPNPADTCAVVLAVNVAVRVPRYDPTRDYCSECARIESWYGPCVCRERGRI